MSEANSHWVADYIRALDEERVGVALSILEDAWEATQGLGVSWNQAWFATARQGFLGGAQRLLNWGVPMPVQRGKTLRERVLLAVTEQKVSAIQRFEKSDGTRFRGVNRKDPQALLECYFGKNSPPLSLAEFKTLYASEQPNLLERVLENPGVQPWGGAPACILVREILTDLMFNHSGNISNHSSRKAIWCALLSNLPEGMGSLASRNAFLQEFLSAARDYTKSRKPLSVQTDSSLISFEQGLELIHSLGCRRTEIADAFRKNQGECLAIVSVRFNSPLGLEWDFERGLNWDASAKLPGLQSRPYGNGFQEGASLFKVIVARLRIGNDPRTEQWWNLCEQKLSSLPDFRYRLARHREDPKHWEPQAWNRWQALIKQVKLDTVLSSGEEVVVPAPRMRL